MGWVTFETDRGGLLKVQTQHVVAIYDEQNTVKLATTASGVHILKDIAACHEGYVIPGGTRSKRYRRRVRSHERGDWRLRTAGKEDNRSHDCQSLPGESM